MWGAGTIQKVPDSSGRRGPLTLRSRRLRGQISTNTTNVSTQRSKTGAVCAQQLGITESAIQKRVQRELLEHDKEPDGRLYVYLDIQDKGRDEVRDRSDDMLVRRLENENEFLRRELERKDAVHELDWDRPLLAGQVRSYALNRGSVAANVPFSRRAYHCCLLASILRMRSSVLLTVGST